MPSATNRPNGASSRSAVTPSSAVSPSSAFERLAPLVASLVAFACGARGDLSLGRIDAPAKGDAAAELESTTDGTESSTDATSSTTTSEDPTSTSDSSTSNADTASSGETRNPGPGDCEDLPSPTQRYDFSGSGTEIIDVMGGPSGSVKGGASLADGAVTLDGDDDYVDLPNGLLGTKHSATILLWVTAIDGPAYWRMLDFGISSGGEDPAPDEPAVGTTYVALTTETGLDPNGMALFIGHGGASAEDRALTSLRFDDEVVALGVVLDGDAARADLYVNGELQATTSLSSPLSELEDVNNWLGRSQYAADPHYPGTYTELRIYDVALSACQVDALTTLGPDVVR